MGMFNTILHAIKCPKTEAVVDSAIQIKWQFHEERICSHYHLGDTLPGLPRQLDNTWIQDMYICPACSPSKTVRGYTLPDYTNGVWHNVYVRLQG